MIVVFVLQFRIFVLREIVYLKNVIVSVFIFQDSLSRCVVVVFVVCYVDFQMEKKSEMLVKEMYCFF